MKKSIAAIILAFIMMITCLNSAAYMYNVDESYELNCKNAIVVNTDTGRTVFEKDADTPVSIASLTKILTAITVIENCTDFDATVEVKGSSLLSIGNTGLVTANLVSGENMSVRDMLHCLLMPSAADASVVLADYIGGSVEDFVEMMNKKADEIGMKNSHFVNTHGLDAEGHYSTARDIAILTGYALKNEMFADIVSQSSYTVAQTNKSAPRNLITTNYLLLKNSGFYYEWADGVKTGYTDNAGRCLVSTAVKDKTRYIAVVMGCDSYNSNGTMACRHFSDSIYLLENAFKTYSLKNVCKKGKEAVRIPIKCLGIDGEVEGVYKNNYKYLMSKNEKAETKINLDKQTLDSPVKKGDRLGTCDIVFEGKTLKTVEIVAGQDAVRNYTKIIINVLILLLVLLVAAAVIIALFITLRKKKSGGRRMKRNVKYQ